MGTIRKAIGSLKDQTSISIAKVAGNVAPDLEVLVVKATSHEDVPADEKYLREILSITSYSRGYVGACVSLISRRIGKTRDWIVALKALMLVHGIIIDGDRVFRQELVYATRSGTRLLNMSGFKDEAHSNSWDHSGFVRAYGLYLDEKLEFMVYEMKSSRNGNGNGDEERFGYGDKRDGERYGYGEKTDEDRFGYGEKRDEDRFGYGDKRADDRFGYEEKRAEEVIRKDVVEVKEMKPERVLERLKQLLRMLDRLLACRPTGAAKNSRLVLVALYPVIRESFKLYAEVCVVLGVLLDRFSEMEYVDCVKAFDTYVSAAKRIDELVGFYNWCKDMGIARSSEFPEVQRITNKLLETLEGFLKERANGPKIPEKSKEESAPMTKEEPEPDMNEIKALPPPETFTPPPSPPPQEAKPKSQPAQQETGELVNLRDEALSADDQGNKFALALFNGPAASNGNGSWEAFPSDGAPEMTSAWQTPAAESGKADWELALAESTSNLSKQKADLAGGFDPLLLNGMYDQGTVRQHVSTTQLSGGSASSVALPGPGKGSTTMLALPAPDGTVQTVGEDPFAASLVVPPPSYVQIADMEKKQHLLVHEQQIWQQYGREGMQGQTALAKMGGAPYYTPGPNPVMMPYGMPPVAGMGQPGASYYAPY